MQPEAFLLLTLPNASLTGGGFTETGQLNLQCVSMPHPDSTDPNSRDIYLVLRVKDSEIPIDPARTVRRSDTAQKRMYTFEGTPSDPSYLVLTIEIPSSGKDSMENLDTFDNILQQYIVEFYGPQASTAPPSGPSTTGALAGVGRTTESKDLRGHLVMINEDTGEVVGEIEDRFRIQEDPIIHQPGHENDPVYIEVPEEMLSTREGDANAMEVFARLVPPDQQNWMTKGATIISHAISMTTSLLITTVTAASNYYVSHSQPSPHHSANHTPGSTSPVPGTPHNGQQQPGSPPPLPPRPKALVFLTSERTRQGLSTVHAMSGEAVKVSSKTVNMIDSMIRRVLGAKPKRQKYFEHGGGGQSFLAPTPTRVGSGMNSGGGGNRATSPTPGNLALPPRSPSPFSTSGGPPPYSADVKGRGPPSPVPPPLPARSNTTVPSSSSSSSFSSSQQPSPQSAQPFHQPKLTTKARILISADLILSTIDDSTRRILDTGTEELGKVVGHKYGSEAKESSLLMAGTARNVGLVYVDVKGVGRRALLRRAGKTWVKKQMSSNTGGPQPPAVPPRPAK